jgi:hypothetical protein
MKFLTKSVAGAAAVAAALVTVAAPAQAQRHDRDRDGISAGEVIAGAVVLGGLGAVLASAGNDRHHDGYGRYGYDDDRYYSRRGGARAAVNRCVNQVEGWAGRYSRSDVTEIRDIDRTRYGYRVQGKLVVRDGWRGRDDHNRGDRYGYGNGYHRGYDRGRFTCYVEHGRVVDIDYRGLDQWR